MKEKIILKSAHPELYGDLEIECKVIPNDKISEYLESISSEKKFVAYKVGEVKARKGKVGEQVRTVLKTIVDGKEYILNEENNTVRERDGMLDIVVTNISSTSNEEYIVKHQKFVSTYTLSENGLFIPVCDPRVLTEVGENVVIMTSWRAPAICLKGSYIVTYDAASNDYNTIEKGAFSSTYTIDKEKTKKIKR